MSDLLGINLKEVFEKFLIDLRQAFTSPSSDPALTLMVTAILFILVTALVLFVVLIYLFFTRGRRVVLYAKTKITERDIWLSRLFFLLFLVVLAFTVNYYTERDVSCLNCHPEQLEKRALEQSAHAGLSCISCHRPPGFSGYIEQKIDFLRMLGVYARLEDKAAFLVETGSVGNSSCLKCHSSVLKEVVESGNLAVSHVEINEGNIACVDCHSQTAHPGITKPARQARMVDCARCHDGKQANNDCSTCHPLNDEGIEFTDIGELPKVSLSQSFDCYGECHNERMECLWCHVVTMPHPPGWASYPAIQHRRYAAFTGKKTCWRCHYPEEEERYFQPNPEFCQKCHPIYFHGRDEDVFYAHQRFTAAECSGLCHSGDFCVSCHEYRVPRDPLPERVRSAPFGFPEDVDF